MPEQTQYYGTGRRKTSTARVYLRPGKGKITINDKTLDDYFGRKTGRITVVHPLKLTQLQDKFDVFITVSGGGITGQSGAIQHGIARALLAYEMSTSTEGSDFTIKKQLRKAGCLTRDSREVERKKVGRHGARRKPQYSKR